MPAMTPVQIELERIFRERTVKAAFFGAALFLLVSPLDYLSAPGLFVPFLKLRLGMAACLAGIGWLARRARSPLGLRAWVILAVLLSAAAIEAMILLNGGAGSPYYAGLMLLGVVVLGLLPAGLGMSLLIAGTIQAAYLLPILLAGAVGDPRVFVTHNYFLAFILGAVVLVGHFSRRALAGRIALARDLAENELRLSQVVEERTEALLRTSSEWRVTVDSTNDLIVLADEEGLIVKANLAAAAFAGRAITGLLGTSVFALFSEEDLPRALHPLETMRRTRRREQAEARVAARGSWYLLTAEPAVESRFGHYGSVITVRDITAVKAMERAIREARDDWEETFDSIHEGITIHDDNFVILRANAAAKRLVGCPGGEIERQRCHEVFHGTDRPIAGCPNCMSVRSGVPTTVDFFEPHLGRYLEVTALPRPAGGVVHVVHDITERKRMIDEIRAWGVRMQAILERAPFGVFTVDDRMRVEFANPAILAITGYARDRFVGACLGDFPACLQLGMKPHILAALRGVPFRIGPASFRCSGGERLVTGRFTGIPVEEGGEAKVLVFLEDLTDLTRANEERQRLAALLLQSQKMESIGTLASGIAHDFNNILLAVIGLTDAGAEQLPAGHPALEHFASVVAAAERGSGLVRQMLAFSRQQELKVQRLDVARLVEDTHRMLAPLVPRTIAFEVRAGEGLPAVVADPVQIGQVLVNLAINARDAMPRGGTLSFETGTLTLAADDAAHPDVPPGRWAVVTVRDTGTGMSPEVRARIFDPFFTTKEPGKGTGLGLATAYGIVSQHGGVLRVESEPGRGSAFSVYLPASEGEGPAAGDGGAPPAGSETILIVDDEEKARAVIGRRLADLGYRVLAAADGAEALQLARGAAGGVDLLLCDVMMPGLTALSTAEGVLGIAPAAKVAFMSGHPEDLLFDWGLLGPADLLLPKTLGPDGIARRIREALDGPGRHAARPGPPDAGGGDR